MFAHPIQAGRQHYGDAPITLALVRSRAWLSRAQRHLSWTYQEHFTSIHIFLAVKFAAEIRDEELFMRWSVQGARLSP